MNEAIHNYLENFGEETRERFHSLYELIYESTSKDLEEKLWAKLPSFYAGNNFIRLIPFKDHINIEAKAVTPYEDKLSGYKITPKGMLQIFHNQELPSELLKAIFKESLR